MNFRKNSKVNTEFNASSMTDIVFLLLIFFIIISSVVKDPALKLVLPKGVNNVNPVNKVVIVSVDKKISKGRLPSELRAVLSKTPEATVSVRGDKNIRYEDVMDLVMTADKLGAKVVLALDGGK
jgi:biopolymer transport protein ExbD